jgi:hypothetical protein
MVQVDMTIIGRHVVAHVMALVKSGIKMIPYNSFRFFKPPRPEIKIPVGMLPHYEDGSWVAQAKMNGTYNIIGVSPEKTLHCLKRDGDKHRNWQPTADTIKAFRNLPGDGWYVFCAELMNDKTPHIKNINYIHDIVVADGQMLVGSKYLDRYALLVDLLQPKQHTEQHYNIVDDRTWVATIFTNEYSFREVYRHITTQSEIEGLVLKSVDTQLSLADMSRGMVKCRKLTKNYGF